MSKSNHGGSRPGAGRPAKHAHQRQNLFTSNFVQGTSGRPSTFFSMSNHVNLAENGSNTVTPAPCDPNVLTSEETSRLESEWASAQTVEDTDGNGNAHVEESLFDNLESLSESMNQAEAEAEAENDVQGVHIEYLLGIVERLKVEIKASGQPECYKNGTFWIYPKDPLFALHATKSGPHGYSPTGLYHLPIFVWLPAVLPERPDKFRCKKCGHQLIRRGWNDNPVARRVRGLHHDYFLLTARFVCNKDVVRDPGCGANYQGTDVEILQQLPRHVQESFPAYITARGAIDKDLMAVMRSLFAGRFGPEPFTALLGEMRHLHHARRELMYLAACTSFRYPNQEAPQPFSEFADKKRYAGTHPSTQFCKSIFVDWMRGHRVFFDRVMASLSGRILKGDHTFKLIKDMAKLAGEPTHDAIYTVVNEWEEARNQALTLTKSLSYVSELYEDIAQGLKDHGHCPTEFMWTDNAAAELAYHESTTRGLAENVVHAELDPYMHLPPFIPPPSVRVVSYENNDLIDSACEHVMDGLPLDDSSIVVGFAVEYEVELTGLGGPGAIPHPQRNRLDVIQISTENTVYVFKVSNIRTSSAVPPLLRALLLSNRVIKIGHSVNTNLLRVAQAWSLPELTDLLETSQTCTIDLGALAKLKGRVKNPASSLATLAAVVLERHINKSDMIHLSRWSASPLSDAQVSYAACHAYMSWKIWEALSKLPSVGLPISESVPGQLVSLYSGKKVVALGTIISHQTSTTVPLLDSDSSEPHVIHITPSRTMIAVEKIILPGYIPTLYKKTLSTLSTMIQPLKIVVARSSLRSRSATSAVEDPSPSSATPVIAPPSSQFIVEDPSTYQFEDNLSDSESDLDDLDSEADLQDVPLHYQSIIEPPSNEPESDDEYGAFGNIDDLIRNFDDDNHECTHPQPSASLDNPLIQPSDVSKPLLTRLFEDLWHVQDRLLRLLHKSHSGFKAFAAAFSQTLLVPDEADVAAVMKVYEGKGLTWSYALRSRSDAIRRRVRRYCPPPEKLVPDLKVLFENWADVHCSVSPSSGPLFSEDARKQANRIVQIAELGLLSDPPGLQLYQEIGTDPEGLTVYRCLRGTNSVEGGIHMALRRAFGSLRASPELADELLANIRHRRNATVGYFNRTGKQYRNHFDTWRSDEIVELAIELGISPSFPIPSILSTRIATKESSGIIKVPKQMVASYAMRRVERPWQEGLPHYRDVPVHLLTHLSTAPKNVYSFLADRQQTEHAVTPLHTQAEFRFYNELLATNAFNVKSSQAPSAAHTVKSINFEKLALRWNEIVNERSPDNIFYKIPQQLERHHKVWAAYRAEKATLLDSIQDRKAITNILNDPKRRSHVLPALKFPGIVANTRASQDGTRPQKSEENDHEESQQHAAGSPEPSDSCPALELSNANQVTPEATMTDMVFQSQSDAAAVDMDAGPNESRLPMGTRKRPKRCAACRDHGCPLADTCKGSGGRARCQCSTHGSASKDLRPSKRQRI